MRETLVKGSVSPKVRGSVVCLPVPAILYLKKQNKTKQQINTRQLEKESWFLVLFDIKWVVLVMLAFLCLPVSVSGISC